MLKRYQVLFEDWLADHLKAISKKYDISFSEAVRIVLCLQIPRMIKIACPKCNTATLDRKLIETIKAANRNKTNMEDLHRLIAKIYFEGRKAAEFWSEEEKKKAPK